MMDDTMTSPTADLAPTRACTRCDGEQTLVGSAHGMGSYSCSTCGMTVGFDLEGQPVEFLLDRGTPARYTRNVFGDRLVTEELRLSAP
jgi:hypothetical protein